jgi:hypothetical protein
MSQLDSKKELLTSLRTGFGIIVAVILTLSAGLINMYYKQNIDTIFAIGVFLDIMLVGILPIILKHIIRNIKDIEEL